jgi:hypothetical protein
MIAHSRMIARFSTAILALGAVLGGAAPARAQLVAASPKWQAWIGCWSDASQAPLATVPVVCIVPTQAAGAVDVVTVDSGKVVSRYTVDASGAEHAVNRDGCTGSESARWSNDGVRVFLGSTLKCGAVERVSTGMMSISPNGEWLNVDAVKAGGNEMVRVQHYRSTTAPDNVSQEISTAATLGLRLDRRAAAIAAGAKLSPPMIVEALHAMDTTAVQAWLVERHESLNLSAKLLVSLSDAGVPGSVTDVLVANEYPDEFHFTRTTDRAMAEGLSPRDSARIAADYLLGRGCDPLSYYSPYGWGVNPCDSYRYGYGYPGRYGYGYGYGSGYGLGYGYGSYGYTPGYYGGVYTGPVVIVPNQPAESHGRAVKGQGYTRSGSGSSTGSPASSTSSSSSGSSSSSSGSSSGSSSASGSSSSGSSSGRTAIPRPPG